MSENITLLCFTILESIDNLLHRILFSRTPLTHSNLEKFKFCSWSCTLYTPYMKPQEFQCCRSATCLPSRFIPQDSIHVENIVVKHAIVFKTNLYPIHEIHCSFISYFISLFIDVHLTMGIWRQFLSSPTQFVMPLGHMRDIKMISDDVGWVRINLDSIFEFTQFVVPRGYLHRYIKMIADDAG